jgi:hypothetical protein
VSEKYSPSVSVLADRYTIEREIGRGGMATVYLARDLRHDRQVALKVMRPDVGVVLGAQRFLREIQITSHLQHPHILPLFDSGEVDGTLFYVAPFVEGESLRQRLRRDGRLSVALALQIGVEVSDALAYAHARGIIHRDVKPENILLSGDHALVADFGIARAISVATSDVLTETGLAVGSPAYMSPEQAMGERDLDPRTDVYSLGCVLYEALSGAPPFAGPGGGLVGTRRFTETAPSIAGVRPDVPAAADQAITHALARWPDERLASAADFVSALKAASAAVAVPTGARVDVRRRRDSTSAGEQARLSRMQSDARVLRRPIAALGAVSFILFFALAQRTVGDDALALAADESRAVHRAKSYLEDRGLAGVGTLRLTEKEFVARDTTISFLRWAHGAVPTTLARFDAAPVWEWHFHLRAKARRSWSVNVGQRGRITAVTSGLPDSASAKRLTRDEARSVAERELVALGWRPERLTMQGDSAVVRASRTDHFFTWRARLDAMSSPGTSSAHVQLVLGIVGDRLGYFRHSLQPPSSFTAPPTRTRPRDTESVRDAMMIPFLVAVVVLIVGTIIHRQRKDDLQWRMAVRLCGSVGLLVVGVGLLEAVVFERSLAQVIMVLPMLALGVLALMLVFTATESVARERMEHSLTGMDDIATGRLVVPEALGAAVWGYIGAGVILAGREALSLLGWVASGSPMTYRISWVFDENFPATWFTSALLGAMLLVLSIVLLIGLASAYPKLSRKPVILWSVPVAVAGLTGMSFRAYPVEMLTWGYLVLVLAVVAWRSGILAGLVACTVAFGLPGTYQLLRTGEPSFVAAGVVNVLALAVPLALAMLAYRKYGPRVRGQADLVLRNSTT